MLLKVFALAAMLAVAMLVPPVRAADGFLIADGHLLRNEHGHGEVVRLRGVNLGGWLEWQSWMCPIDSSHTLLDGNPGHNGYDFEVRKLLAKRFGPVVAEDLVNAYRDAWISDRDLDNIKSLGLNVVRLTLAYDTMLKDDGTWRGDAFKRSDWLVKHAWERGLYTILDYHAFLPPSAHQDGSAKGYWQSEAQMAETVRIWTRIADHYRGNPAVAMYDLLNEPTNSSPKNRPPPSPTVVCELYDRLYKAIRGADADHAIAMEGMWDWQTLRDPAKCGYRNVVYSFHWYHWNGGSTNDDVQAATRVFQKWNVPVFIGEFNLFGDKNAWKYALQQYDKLGLSWTMWTCKVTASGSNSWGVYTTIPGNALPVPNLTANSAEEIRRKWRSWTTSPEAFALNPMFEPLLTARPSKRSGD